MSLEKARKHLKKAEQELEKAGASEDAQEILDRIHHQLSPECRLVGQGRIDSDGEFYKGVRECDYRDDN